ncbi:MAG: hypothetical protein HW380_3710 [Magnetococcales bacterium]|nr:hypothetical protein [Magnetococcales bacterium]
MGAKEILIAMNGSGLNLSLVGESIRVSPPEKLTDEFRAMIREHKTVLLEFLREPPPPSLPKTAHEFFAVFGKWPWNFSAAKPHPGRKWLKPEFVDRVFFHWCPECGRWGAAGRNFNPTRGKLGEWYCEKHFPKT